MSRGKVMEKKFWIFLILTILYAGMIFALSSSPSPPGSEEGKATIPYFSHVAHTTLYFGLAFCVFHTLYYYPKDLEFDIYLATFLITLLYGISDEIHQFFVPNRQFTLIDIFFNALGGLILVTLMYRYRKYKRKPL